MTTYINNATDLLAFINRTDIYTNITKSGNGYSSGQDNIQFYGKVSNSNNALIPLAYNGSGNVTQQPFDFDGKNITKQQFGRIVDFYNNITNYSYGYRNKGYFHTIAFNNINDDFLEDFKCLIILGL